ncbi:hypothetical protein AB0E66_27070 [Streptomyces sp. NPDC033753]
MGVDLFAGDDDGNTWRPGRAKLNELQTMSVPTVTIVTLAAGSDGNYD